MPISLRIRRPRFISCVLPHNTLPTGAPNPFEKQKESVSNPATRVLTEFQKPHGVHHTRAIHMTLRPFWRASADSVSKRSSGQIVPPPFAVSDAKRVAGA